MRYVKGSLVLNRQRDLPVLRRIVTRHSSRTRELFEFIRLPCGS
jgi:hypothetical protein